MTKLVICGEAWGDSEYAMKRPFIGPSGQELDRMLKDAGLSRDSIFFTNVFNDQPPSNDLRHFMTKQGQDFMSCVKEEYKHHIDRLVSELNEHQPNLIIAAGATASWFFCGEKKIGQARGKVFQGPCKILPMYHPAAVLRNWSLRAVTVADLMKAKREAEFPEIRRPVRRIHIAETVRDLLYIERVFHENSDAVTSFDVETKNRQITCIGFSVDERDAYVIPIIRIEAIGTPEIHYWSAQDEVTAWRLIYHILISSAPKLGQNGLYDIQYLFRTAKIPVLSYDHDTMLMHHALQPEMPKSLEFLASVYTNELSWKHMRKKAEADEFKRDA